MSAAARPAGRRTTRAGRPRRRRARPPARAASARPARPAIITIFVIERTFCAPAPTRMPRAFRTRRTSHQRERDEEDRVPAALLRRQEQADEVLGADERDARRARALHERLRPVQHERERRVVAVRDDAVVAARARVARADLRERERPDEAHEARERPREEEAALRSRPPSRRSRASGRSRSRRRGSRRPSPCRTSRAGRRCLRAAGASGLSSTHAAPRRGGSASRTYCSSEL